MNSVQSSIIVRPFGAQRQVIISLGDTHVVLGSSLIRDTKSQPIRPRDLLLASLATDCIFACQDGANDLGFLLDNLSVIAHWVDSNAAELRFVIGNVNDQQVRELIAYIMHNSTIYRMLYSTVTITFRFNS